VPRHLREWEDNTTTWRHKREDTASSRHPDVVERDFLSWADIVYESEDCCRGIIDGREDSAAWRRDAVEKGEYDDEGEDHRRDFVNGLDDLAAWRRNVVKKYSLTWARSVVVKDSAPRRHDVVDGRLLRI
jgi:hypothetical protein